MKANVQQLDGKWRLVDERGWIYKQRMIPVDGGGYATEAEAVTKAQEINGAPESGHATG